VPVTGGALTNIGTITGLPGAPSGGAFDAAGTLFIQSATSNNLYTVPLTGGAVTLVGNAGAAVQDLATVPVALPTVAKSFTPATVGQGATSVLTITLSNPASVQQRGAAFTDTHPANLVNAATPAAATTCGGTVTAAAGGSSVALSGGTIPASGSCTVTVTVTSATVGTYVNTIAAGGLLTVIGANTAAATATLTVTAPSLKGMVFEDVNYGGGAGRSAASSSGVGRSGAQVELYTSAGVYSTFTTTDASGNYSFTGLAAGTYYVRVVNSSVTSSRSGYTASALPVQTYRTDATSGTAVAVTDNVGGTNPAVADPGGGSAGATFNTTTFVYTAVLSGTAQSVTKAVISAADITGLDFGFNFNTIVNTNNSGQGSLRQFIANANLLSNSGLAQSGRTAGIDNAIWMISNGTAAAGLRSANNHFSGGVATIAPASALPAITDPAILDAQTQPGWSSAPIVQLSGAGAGAGARGLDLEAGGSTVRGLIINGFTGNSNSAGIWIGTAGSNTIQGNYIGTNAAGSAASANYQGILVTTSSNTIGGSAATQRNVISGNTWRAILVDNTGGAAASNVIQGNYVGTDATGTTAIANNIGIYLYQSPNNVIGGTGVGQGNVTSGNTSFGIYLVYSGANGNLVQGNTIGLNASRSGPVPNGSSGIEFCCTGNGGTGNTIGGTVAGAANVISSNTGVGILMRGGTGNGILGNSIYGNGGIGIDLGADGVTPNDGAKPAGQPNLQMDFAVFTSVLLSGTTLTVTGYVGSAAGQSLFAGARVEIFKSDNDPSGYGEGQAYLGFVTADASGNINGSITGVAGLSVGNKITGTATDASNNTSEFGANVTVAAPAPSMNLAESVTPSGTQPPGTDLAYTSTFTNAGTGAAQSVVITDPIPANTDFKVGSVTQNLGTTGLTVVVAYSSDGGSTWTYTPVSGAGGAPAGYDRLVTHIRWTFTGNLSQTAPNNSGSTGATMRVR